jgi:AcrR family transcriptional regulator
VPKIDAPSLAEHRAARRRALLDAAHELLKANPEAPALGDVAERAGVARSSVYQYFASRRDLLAALAQDTFPRWTERITGAMAAAPTPADRVTAYALANLDLVAEGEHVVGTALAALTPGEELDEQAHRMHRQIQEPLIATLEELGATDPAAVAEMINGMVHAGTRLLESGHALEDVRANLLAVLGPFVAAHGGAGR